MQNVKPFDTRLSPNHHSYNTILTMTEIQMYWAQTCITKTLDSPSSHIPPLQSYISTGNSQITLDMWQRTKQATIMYPSCWCLSGLSLLHCMLGKVSFQDYLLTALITILYYWFPGSMCSLDIQRSKLCSMHHLIQTFEYI